MKIVKKEMFAICILRGVFQMTAAQRQLRLRPQARLLVNLVPEWASAGSIGASSTKEFERNFSKEFVFTEFHVKNKKNVTRRVHVFLVRRDC
jgi:hypothetical protein